ncbi:MDR family MFS transporter [Sinomonas sp. P47F7]|uniref:MDR family MFS transporter n=1 Tax=Sinomonas sp. P47F7 TaxID=3410987 RepID=UPI003BF4608E
MSAAFDASVPAPRTYRQVLTAMSGLMLGMLLAAMDQTIVATALPTIVGELNGLQELSWVVTAYFLASSVVMPLYGKLGDLYGRKPLFLIAIVVFLIGSVAAGLSQSMAQLIAFRALQGVGGGGLMVGAQATIADIVTPRERGRYQGYMGAVFGLASVAGPLIGGYLTDYVSWRWIFYINLPIGAVALAVVSKVLRVPRREGERRIDFLGAVLLGGALTCIVLLTTWGGTTVAWNSPTIYALGAAGVVLLVGFVFAERAAAVPIIPLRLFRLPAFDVAAAVSFIVGFAMFGGIAFLPLFLQIVSGASATNSGLLLVPMMAGLIVAAGVSGQIISRTGHYKWSPIVGALVVGTAFYLLSTMGVATDRLTSGLYMVILGLGIGLTMQVMVVIAQNAAAIPDVGTATSTVTLGRLVGGSLGVSIFGSIFTSRLTDQLAQHLPAVAASRLPSTDSITPALISRLPAALRQGFELAFSNALTGMFVYAIPIIALAFVLVLTLREVPLRGSEDNERTTAGAGRAGERGRHVGPGVRRFGRRLSQRRGVQ